MISTITTEPPAIQLHTAWGARHWSTAFFLSLLAAVVIHESGHLVVGLTLMYHSNVRPHEFSVLQQVATTSGGLVASGLAVAASVFAVTRKSLRSHRWWVCVGLSSALRFVLMWPIIVAAILIPQPGRGFDEAKLSDATGIPLSAILLVEIVAILTAVYLLGRNIPSLERRAGWLALGISAVVGGILLIIINPGV